MPVLLADRPLWVDNRHSAEGSSRYIVGNAKVLLDSADALQEVIDFFREARDVLGSDFKRGELRNNFYPAEPLPRFCNADCARALK
jgi:hypothetical protein